MTYDFPSYTLAYLVNTFITLALALVALRRRRAPGAAAFAGVMLAAAIWSLAQVFEAGSVTISSKLFWSQVQYIGVVSVPPLWFLFAVGYTRSHLLDGRRAWLLAIIPAITLVLVWTNPLHGLVWSNIELVPGSPNVAIFSHGLWFWIHTIFSYVMVISGSILLVRESIYAPRIRQYQTLALVAGALAPMLANIVYLMGLLPWQGVDLTTFAFTVTGAIYLPTLFGLRVLDLMPVARGAVVEQMGDAVLVLDGDGRIADFNPAVMTLLSVNVSAWIGQPFSEAMTAFPALVALGDADAPAQTIITLRTEPPVVLDVRKTTLHDSKARPIGALLLLRDITQFKVAERREFDLALEQERVRLLSRFIRDASHEFRTPLAVVNTSLYLLDRQTDPALQRAQREKIAAQVERLNSLLEDMLTMSKLDEGESFALSDVYVNGLWTGIVEAGCGHQEKQVTVSLELDETLPPVRGDALQLHRAFANLFCNAVQYSIEGGSIRISTRERGGFVVISLHDTGIGIDHIAQNRIFERFFRTDEVHATTGMGLGLPIARAIIEAHGGVIEVQSAPGQGSTFTLQLPAYAPEPAANGQASAVMSRRLAEPLRASSTPSIETP
ncbi:MAG TPA: histidine kinase N-terminal 7TM domain-containing protein [Candidatus Limnocylindrales bacterium]|nr:histidine kinase N-terminal 7TM domain-containing protein [Candidatus Limnocylindrales bacterium]